MTTKYHSQASVSSRHPIHGISEFADTTARDAHVYTAFDIGKVVSTGTGTARRYWVVVNQVAGVATYREVGLIGDARYYDGYSVSSVTWSSLTWTGVHNALTFTDVVTTQGITRSSSTFTVTDAGVYVFAFNTQGYNTTGNDTFAIRLRKSGVTLAMAPSGYTEAGASRLTAVSLHRAVALAAGDAVSIEYAASATYNAYAPVTIDSETGRTATCSIYRIGN